MTSDDKLLDDEHRTTGLSERNEQRRLLKTPLGQFGSGYIRYGAAMWLFQNGLLEDELLESYRVCCKLDNQDPIEVYKSRTLSAL